MTNFDDPGDAPRSDDLARLARIRRAFTDAGYTVDGVGELLGEEVSAALHRDLLVPASLRLDALPPSPLASLIRVYLLAETVAASDVPAADDQLEAGLFEPDPRESSRLRAKVDVRPYAIAEGDQDADLWVASDLGGVQLDARHGSDSGAALRRDHVVGIGPATATLAQLAPPAPVGSALDLGVGMGVQTMHLLGHARRVVATDISARAIAFARFNLLLSAPALGIDPERLEDRVELRLGDLLEPVVGERFDLIVSNPPFVITPRREDESASDQYTYRDGGRPGDRLVEELVRGLGEVLAPDGIAVMLGNWEIHHSDASWHARPESWPAAGIDLWIVQRERATPIEYADMWLRDAAENRELETWRGQFARYLDDFARRGVEAVGMGMLLLHRRAEGDEGAVLRRFETLEHRLGQPLGAAIRDSFDAQTWLRANDDEALLDETLVVAADVTEERWSMPGAEHPSAILLRQGGGFRRTFPETTELSGVVSVCDGELTLGQIVRAMSALLEVDETAMADAVLADVRELVGLGFLTPRWM